MPCSAQRSRSSIVRERRKKKRKTKNTKKGYGGVAAAWRRRGAAHQIARRHVEAVGPRLTRTRQQRCAGRECAARRRGARRGAGSVTRKHALSFSLSGSVSHAASGADDRGEPNVVCVACVRGHSRLRAQRLCSCVWCHFEAQQQRRQSATMAVRARFENSSDIGVFLKLTSTYCISAYGGSEVRRPRRACCRRARSPRALWRRVCCTSLFVHFVCVGRCACAPCARRARRRCARGEFLRGELAFAAFSLRAHSRSTFARWSTTWATTFRWSTRRLPTAASSAAWSSATSTACSCPPPPTIRSCRCALLCRTSRPSASRRRCVSLYFLFFDTLSPNTGRRARAPASTLD